MRITVGFGSRIAGEFGVLAALVVGGVVLRGICSRPAVELRLQRGDVFGLRDSSRRRAA